MSGEDSLPNTEHRTPNTSNRNWVWFFVILAALGAAAVGINWAYNARQQLTREQLNAAMDRWEKHGPADYDLVVEKTFQSSASDAPTTDRIEVRVRQKQVVEAAMNGRPLERRLWGEYDVPGWFGFVERFVQIDSAPGAPRTFRSADFEPVTGQLQRYRRSVSGSHERQELILTLKAVNNP
jgi:hypothetical protein